MSTTEPSPLGEAVERLGEAGQAYLDGPVAFLREAADRASQPTYDADAAAGDIAGYGIRLAQSWVGWMNAMVDAVAVAGIPPGQGHRFVVTVPGAGVARSVQLASTTWTWMLGPEPPGAVVALRPPMLLDPGDTIVRVVAKPLVVEPSWKVRLVLTPMDGSADTVLEVDLGSFGAEELASDEDWP